MGASHAWFAEPPAPSPAPVHATQPIQQLAATLELWESMLRQATAPPIGDDPAWWRRVSRPHNTNNQQLVHHLFAAGDQQLPVICAELMGGEKTQHYSWWAFPTAAADRRTHQHHEVQFTCYADATEYMQHPLLRYACVRIWWSVLYGVCRRAKEMKTPDPLRTVLGDVDAPKFRASVTYLVYVACRDFREKANDALFDLLVLAYFVFVFALQSKWSESTLDQACERVSASHLSATLRDILNANGQRTFNAILHAVCERWGVEPGHGYAATTEALLKRTLAPQARELRFVD